MNTCGAEAGGSLVVTEQDHPERGFSGSERDRVLEAVEARGSAREPARSRRAWLAGVAGTALGGLAGIAGARRSVAAQPVGSSTDIDPGALLLKLVNRVTWGYTEAEYARALQLGYWGYLEEQMALTEAEENPALVSRLASYTTLPMTGEQIYALGNPGLQKTELIEAMTLRAIMSKRQLFERLVEFWTDHFNINIDDEQCQYLKTIDDREVIRRYALGSFPQLLDASAHSPAMLTYLDNDVNTKNGINENYGREVQELHTMGVNSGYTQSDVQACARAFTGWTRYSSGTNPANLRGTFRYNDNNHDKTAKTFLGHPLASGRGIQDGLDVIAILAYEPRTAAYIARKLCRKFIGETCPQGHIDAVAATYQSTGGDIKQMLRTLFNPRVLWDAPLRYKRPFHLMVSGLRTLPITINSLSSLRSRFSAASHVPFTWVTPDGFPDSTDYWSGLILPRWNFAATASPGSASNIQVSASLLSPFTTAQQIVDRLNGAVFGGAMTTFDNARIAQYIGAGNPTQAKRDEAIGLALGTPTFQWY